MTHRDHWANTSATMWDRLLTHLKEESGQVSTAIAQGPSTNIIKNLDLHKATHWALTAWKTVAATKPTKPSIPIWRRHQKHTSRTHLMKKEDIQQRIKIYFDKVQSKILFMNKDTNNVLHSQKETSSENVYMTHITTNMLLPLRLMLSNWILPEKRSNHKPMHQRRRGGKSIL